MHVPGKTLCKLSHYRMRIISFKNVITIFFQFLFILGIHWLARNKTKNSQNENEKNSQ